MRTVASINKDASRGCDSRRAEPEATMHDGRARCASIGSRRAGVAVAIRGAEPKKAAPSARVRLCCRNALLCCRPSQVRSGDVNTKEGFRQHHLQARIKYEHIPSLHGEVTALLPQVRSRGARAVGLIGRDGPALRRRPRSLEAGLLLRLRAGTWARTCGGGPCCLLSSLRASAPARGMRVRGSARTGRGGNRDGPSLASHCARAAERVQRTQTRTGTPPAAARGAGRYLAHGPPRRPRRATAPSPRLRQRWRRRAPSSAQR